MRVSFSIGLRGGRLECTVDWLDAVVGELELLLELWWQLRAVSSGVSQACVVYIIAQKTFT